MNHQRCGYSPDNAAGLETCASLTDQSLQRPRSELCGIEVPGDKSRASRIGAVVPEAVSVDYGEMTAQAIPHFETTVLGEPNEGSCRDPTLGMPAVSDWT